MTALPIQYSAKRLEKVLGAGPDDPWRGHVTRRRHRTPPGHGGCERLLSAAGEAALGVRAAAEAKISAFIQMLGNDSRLLSGDEEIISHELFARLNSRRTLTGEDETETSELDYLREIRTVRDEQPALFARIKRLPKKARATHTLPTTPPMPITPVVQAGLLTYFRLGKLDKFFVCERATSALREIDFLTAAQTLKTSVQEKAQAIPIDFYGLLDKNKAAFAQSTQSEAQDNAPRAKDRSNDTYILRRLKTPEIQRWHGLTDDDTELLRRTRSAFEDGALPIARSKQIADAIRKTTTPLKVLAILRDQLPAQLLQILQKEDAGGDRIHRQHLLREVILSSVLIAPVV